MEEIVLIGGGGHCKACIEVIEAAGKFRIAGIIDIKEKAGTKIFGYEIFGSDEGLPKFVKDYRNFLITLGHIKDPGKRIEKYDYLKERGAIFPVIVSPDAHVSKYASIADGTIIMHKACIGANVKIGENCIVNTGAIVEHDAVIEKHCHISTGAIVNGECVIGEGTFIGSNSVLANNITIAGKSTIGAGSVVVKSLSRSGTYAGNPGKRIDRE
ncbi:MAG: acetyltransferase [Candidatus Brocadia sp. UTAMX2]|jgi:sugar O-acyltransferase (sialic acid O-acetyltransferase NeuD family)|nr:MAG: acetyltransferase [Candidatus Brocadia sp. UTAMX2]